MADITMPRLSDTMEEGTIASWLKKPGEQIKKGDIIAQIETDKATMDLTAFEAGTLQEILAPEGASVAIGKPVARIGSGAASAPSASAPSASAPPSASPPPSTSPPSDAAPLQEAAASPPPGAESTDSVPPQTEAARQNLAEAPDPAASPPAQATAPVSTESVQVEEPPAANGTNAADGKVRASPLARHLAAELGLKLSQLKGSGPQGRIIRADVEAAISLKSAAPASPDAEPADAVPQAEATTTPPPAEPSEPPATQPAAQDTDDDERVSLSQMRRTIARRMAESTRTVPHFFLTTTVDATPMVALRKQILEQVADPSIKITFNDLVVKAAALALRKVPDVNVSFAEDSLIRHKRIHIGVAVATERGLIVPVLRDADQKSIGQIGRETRDLAERATSGKLQPQDYSGGTFTISNLGMFGVEQFNAVINPPESAILAVGAIAREPAEYDGQLVLRERMKLTLSVDHRALDGAIGARYLQALKQLLETPMLLLV